MCMARRFASSLLASLLIVGCATEEAELDLPPIDIADVEVPDVEEPEQPPCEIVFELPEGDSYAMTVTSFEEPATIAGIVRGYLDSIPPLILFADGLTDGAQDAPVHIVGGIGERVGFGVDDTPDTENDVYTMHFGSINPATCDFQVRLEGSSEHKRLVAFADVIHLNLDGLSAVTEGLSLQIDEVTLEGDFDESLGVLDDVLLSGILGDEGLEVLLEAARDYIPLSREQAMQLLDPDGTGTIFVRLGLKGRRVIVEGYSDPWSSEEAIARVEEPCCPEGLEVGDPIFPFLAWERQGLQDEDLELFYIALPVLRDDPKVAMIATAIMQDNGEVHYHVYSGSAAGEGHVVYRRLAGDDGRAPRFEIVEVVGQNPLGNDDPTALASYETFLSTGINPNEVTYAGQGYGIGDPRLAFIPAHQMHYPFGYERIAQNFDDPRTGDLIIIPASWATGGFGNHGHLGALQSRSPLLISGPGVRTAGDADGPDFSVEDAGSGQTLLVEKAARQVDIAPTVAAALGVARTTGVGPDMRLRDDVYLKWQDGRVLTEIFTDEALAMIEAGEPVAQRAIIIVNDGLTNIEILFQTLSDDPSFEVDSYQRLLQRGLAYRYGSISNFPSNTYPGHNALGSGAWGGHHGIIDNTFRVREQGIQVSPIGEIFQTEYLMGSAHKNLPVETLHEAVVRSFGDLSQGVLAASINEPSTRGAEFATLERRLPGGFTMPASGDYVLIGNEQYSLPLADLSDYAGVMDNASLQTFAYLFQDHILRGQEEGLPIPKYTIANFGSTDSAGHAHGPHGDHERFTVISRVNQRMGAMLDLLEYLEIDDSTLVVLTSDHGMELQDTSRAFWRGRGLQEAGVHFHSAGWFFYFKQLHAEILDTGLDADVLTLAVEVVDRDTAQSDNPRGVEGVTMRVVDGGAAAEVVSDAEGKLSLVVLVEEGAQDLLLEFHHPQWNTTRKRIRIE